MGKSLSDYSSMRAYDAEGDSLIGTLRIEHALVGMKYLWKKRKFARNFNLFSTST